MKKELIKIDKPGEKDLKVIFDKEGEEKEVKIIIDGKSEGDYVLRVVSDHKVGNSFGRVVIRGIARNGARIKIQGLVKIEKGADGVDDFLEMRVLLLDDKSQATAEPMLEIEANEVKASHAAAVSPIDAEQLFYLQARGVTETMAKDIIVKGFLAE